MKFALSTDANHGGVAYEGIYAAMGGMTNEEALAGLTAQAGASAASRTRSGF